MTQREQNSLFFLPTHINRRTCYDEKHVMFITCAAVKSMVPVKGEKTCMACEMVLAYARSFLNNPDNQKPIEQVLVEVCKILPASYRGVVSVSFLFFIQFASFTSSEFVFVFFSPDWVIVLAG